MKKILTALFLLAAIGANGQTLLGERHVDTTMYFGFSVDSAMVIQLKDYIIVEEDGTVYIYGDTIKAVRWLYAAQLDAWQESKEWQGRYFHLMDRIKNLK